MNLEIAHSCTALANTHERVIHVRVWPDAIGGEPVDVRVKWGSTVAEIIEAIPLRPDQEIRRRYFEVYFGNHKVYREKWHVVRPTAYAEKGAFIGMTVRLPLHGGGGGGGGKKILAVVATIVLIAVTAFIGGGGLVGLLGSSFAAGTFGASAAAAVVGIAGQLLIQGLLRQGEDKEGRDTLGFAGAENSFEPGGYLPRVLGRTLVSPATVVPPFTTINNGEQREDDSYEYSQYVTTVVALAGPHEHDEIRVGGVDIDTISDIEYEVRSGLPDDEPLTLVTKTYGEDLVNLAMSEWEYDSNDDNQNWVPIEGTELEAAPDWHRVETRKDPDSFRIEYVFGSGLVFITPGGEEAGQPRGAAVALRHRFRRRNGDTWGDWVNIPEIMVRAKEANSPIRIQLHIHWVDEYPEIAGNDWPPEWKEYNKLKGWSQIYSHSEWLSDLISAVGDGYVQWSYESDKIVRLYLLTSEFQKGRYQFEVKRSWPIRWADYSPTTRTVSYDPEFPFTTGDFFTALPMSGDEVGLYLNPSDFSHQITITSRQSVLDKYPIEDDGEAVFLLAIRARDRQLGRIEVVASSLVDDWDPETETWVPLQRSSNPASHFRHVTLEAEHNSEPIPEVLVNMEALQDWHEWCTLRNHQCNTVGKGQLVPDVLRIIAQAGFASPTFGASYSVVPDRRRVDGPVGLISQRNAGGFYFRKPFSDRPHALRVTVRDNGNEWVPFEIIVYAPGYAAVAGGGLKEATRFEAIVYPGIEVLSQAFQRAALDLSWSVYRRTLYGFNMDFENLEFTRGDLLLMETDILGQQDGRGYITSITIEDDEIVEITIDEDARYGTADPDNDTPTGEPGILIRAVNGSQLAYAVEAPGSDRRVIVPATPIPVPTATIEGELTDLIQVGNLLITGRFASIARQVILWDVEPGEDMTAQIIAVDYAGDAVYGEEGGGTLDIGDGEQSELDVGGGFVLAFE